MFKQLMESSGDFQPSDVEAAGAIIAGLAVGLFTLQSRGFVVFPDGWRTIGDIESALDEAATNGLQKILSLAAPKN